MAKILLIVDNDAVSIQIRDAASPAEEEQVEKSPTFAHIERFAKALARNAWASVAPPGRQALH